MNEFGFDVAIGFGISIWFVSMLVSGSEYYEKRLETDKWCKFTRRNWARYFIFSCFCGWAWPLVGAVFGLVKGIIYFKCAVKDAMPDSKIITPEIHAAQGQLSHFPETSGSLTLAEGPTVEP